MIIIMLIPQTLLFTLTGTLTYCQALTLDTKRSKSRSTLFDSLSKTLGLKELERQICIASCLTQMFFGMSQCFLITKLECLHRRLLHCMTQGLFSFVVQVLIDFL